MPGTDEPRPPQLIDHLREAPRAAQIIIALAAVAFVSVFVVGLVAISNSGGTEADDDESAVSQACLSHFEASTNARAEQAQDALSATHMVFADMSGAFSDCMDLDEWKAAAARFPTAISNTSIEGFVRLNCGTAALEGTPTCVSLE